MKALAINITGALLILLIGILLAYIFIRGNLTRMLEWINCKLARMFLPSLPSYCKKFFPAEIKKVYIEKNSNLEFSRELLKYILNCWKNSKQLNLNTHICYEVEITKLPVENVTELNITKVLREEYLCEYFQNSDYDCGVMDNLVWYVDGKIKSTLTSIDVLNAINNVSIPTTLFKDNFTITIPKSKLEMKKMLEKDIPQEICKKILCNNWHYNSSNYAVIFNVSSKILKYDIFQVLSFLEKNGFIHSPINMQKVLFIKYNKERNCVEVIG